MDSYRKTKAAYESGALGAELCPVTVPGGRGKPDLVFTADEEYHNVNFDKFTKLRTIFEVSLSRWGGEVGGTGGQGVVKCRLSVMNAGCVAGSILIHRPVASFAIDEMAAWVINYPQV